MTFPRQSGKPIRDILKVLESMTPEQYALVNRMVRDELENRILYGSPENRRKMTLMEVRANLKKRPYSPPLKGILNL